MTRKGKIAHLPGNIRDELNRRLENGEEGVTLLPWLNALPEVLEILKENFDGLPITKQNLSEWRQGGFREWQIRDDLIAQARQLSDGASEMEDVVDTPLLPGALAGVLAARYAALLNSWDGEPDPKFEDKLRLLRRLNQDIALLQKTMQQASRQQRDSEHALEEREQRELEKEKESIVAPIWARLERDQLAGIFGGGEWGKKMAEVVTAVKYDLPSPEERAKEWEELKRKMEETRRQQAKSQPPGQSEFKVSNPQSVRGKSSKIKVVKPSHTKSNPAKPSQTAHDPVTPSPTESDPVSPGQTQSNPVKPDLAASAASDATSDELNKVDPASSDLSQ
jgi:hypothetical protein